MTKDTARNASGDIFEIWRRDGRWYAEQITGSDKNYMGIAALVHADSRGRLLADLTNLHSAA